jgi:Holliday junction resolvase RusA-like endonuclease
MEIQDLLVVSQGDCKMVDFVVLGEPLAQNGWKIAWNRGRGGRPYLYDPNSREKKRLKVAVKSALLEFDESVPVSTATKLHLGVVFYLRNATSKDEDKMIKCLQDALQGFIYDNDKGIFSLKVVKAEDPILPKTVVTISEH